ncbi:hypothetical protein R0381_001097 [Jeongeupia wiesaeckerbachi]|uniref:hypothetical protein n=1 Tax=Jeongeupia wiesaeckerbachi TaxID=3051218 RepID=UPI003D809AC7
MAMRPTMLPSAPAEHGTPKASETPARAVMRPTLPVEAAPVKTDVTTVTAMRPTVPVGPSAAEVPVDRPAMQPTLPAGSKTTALNVDLDAVRARFPELDEATLRHFMVAVGQCNRITLERQSWVHWGAPLQHACADLIETTLELASDPTQTIALRHLRRLAELLGEVAESAAIEPSLWRRGSPKRALAERREEIDLLRDELRAVLPALTSFEASVADASEATARLQHSIQGWPQAAAWLLDQADYAPGLLERGQSMLKSLTLLHQQQLQLQALRDQVCAIAAQIQHGVLVDIPTWLSAIAGLPDELNETQRYTLKNQIDRLIDSLNS